LLVVAVYIGTATVIALLSFLFVRRGNSANLEQKSQASRRQADKQFERPRNESDLL
jgi:hypothetical protein